MPAACPCLLPLPPAAPRLLPLHIHHLPPHGRVRHAAGCGGGYMAAASGCSPVNLIFFAITGTRIERVLNNVYASDVKIKRPTADHPLPSAVQPPAQPAAPHDASHPQPLLRRRRIRSHLCWGVAAAPFPRRSERHHGSTDASGSDGGMKSRAMSWIVRGSGIGSRRRWEQPACPVLPRHRAALLPTAAPPRPPPRLARCRPCRPLHPPAGKNGAVGEPADVQVEQPN